MPHRHSLLRSPKTVPAASKPYSDQFLVSRGELQDFVAKWQKYEKKQEEREPCCSSNLRISAFGNASRALSLSAFLSFCNRVCAFQ